MKTSKMINISVVICTRNRGDSVVPTLATLLENTGTDFEIILVDQSSDNETAVAITSFCSDERFRYLPSDTVGTGLSRNIGLHESNGDIVLYTDDDCRVPNDWIETMAGIFEANERVGMAFCNVIAGPFDEEAGFVPTYIIDNDFVATSTKDKWRARGIGAGMALRREVALSIGGFDGMLGPGSPLSFTGCEEGDMAARILISGWWVFETCKTAVIHDGFRTWEEGKALSKRNWIGVGAAYSKPIKGGVWQFAPVVFFEGFVNFMVRSLSSIVKFKKPHGLKQFIFFWVGFYHGFKVPIDKQRLLFRPEG